jgi:hypothetical protein
MPKLDIALLAKVVEFTGIDMLPTEKFIKEVLNK